MTSLWAWWRLKSPASQLFTQRFFQAQIKENIKASRHWPLCGEFTGDRWIPRTKGQKRGKCYHMMMSSWLFIEWSILAIPFCYLWSDNYDLNHINALKIAQKKIRGKAKWSANICCYILLGNLHVSAKPCTTIYLGSCTYFVRKYFAIENSIFN